MKKNTENLKKIKNLEGTVEYASLFFNKDEIRLLNCNAIEIIDNEDKIIMRAKLKAEASIRKMLFIFAKNGSTPAVALFNEIIKRSYDEENS